jgi:hypothetical protein
MGKTSGRAKSVVIRPSDRALELIKRSNEKKEPKKEKIIIKPWYKNIQS